MPLRRVFVVVHRLTLVYPGFPLSLIVILVLYGFAVASVCVAYVGGLSVKRLQWY